VVSQLVVLNLGRGDCQQGFSLVTLQLWLDEGAPMQLTGSLPAAPDLEFLYAQWQALYAALYSRRNWRNFSMNDSDQQSPNAQVRRNSDSNAGSRSEVRSKADFEDDFEIEEDSQFIADVSDSAFKNLCQELQQQLNCWLNAESFRPLDRQLRTRLIFTEEVRVIVVASDRRVLRLPWHLWQLFEDYPKAELALSLADYTRSLKSMPVNPCNQVRILVILGNSDGIHVDTDQWLLEQLPQTQLTCLVEPTLAELHNQLWQPGWDILFFAGHSSSQGAGTISINATEQLTLPQLKFALKKAIERGLKLAIFNSCDGLGLAWDLADLQIPQVIVMRESIPDRVAHEFLKHFLTAFSGGQSFYLAVREARERLQALEGSFLCATWLPVICQNPAEVPPRWLELRGLQGASEGGEVGIAAGREAQEGQKEPSFRAPSSTTSRGRSDAPVPLESRPGGFSGGYSSLLALLLTSVLSTTLILGLRLLGWLQPLELWGFDRLMMLRPVELPDARLLIVTLDEADIQAQDAIQGATQRRGSLSDQALEQALTILERYQPRAIGLDIYRDFPVTPQTPGLKARLRNNRRLVVVCKNRDARFDPAGIAPPPEVPDDQVGFSDFIADPDGIVRRQVLFQSPDPASPCMTPYAVSTRLAFRYLDAEKVVASFKDGNLHLGAVEFRRLDARSGGYQMVDTRGNQMMINYRALPSARAIAPQVSLTELLQGKVNADTVKDRLVLIGITANSNGDVWTTPFGASASENVPGVFVQAQMTSQVISAVLDRRPLIWTWHWLGETLWIWGWAVAGGMSIIWVRSRVYRAIVTIILLSILSASSLMFLIQGAWVPWMPAGISFLSTSTILLINPKKLRK
jgi:CHASE2 domain-containing sensor protein